MFPLLAATAAFLQPTTSDAYRKYLLGEWELKKAITFKAGGLSGRFEGRASFEALDEAAPNLLAYSESGIFTSESGSTSETRNRLLYDFSEWSKVDVFYDVAVDRSSARSIVESARLLYSLVPDSAEAGVMRSAAATDGSQAVEASEDEYRGDLQVSAENAFLSTWEVSGPAQQGHILSLFRRADASRLAEEDKRASVIIEADGSSDQAF